MVRVDIFYLEISALYFFIAGLKCFKALLIKKNNNLTEIITDIFANSKIIIIFVVRALI